MPQQYFVRKVQNFLYTIVIGSDLIILTIIGVSKLRIYLSGTLCSRACVQEGEDIAKVRLLTKTKTLTLGMAGNGPLTELASLKEYSKNMKVKNIFWIYFERNDLNDLKKEKKKRY